MWIFVVRVLEGLVNIYLDGRLTQYADVRADEGRYEDWCRLAVIGRSGFGRRGVICGNQLAKMML